MRVATCPLNLLATLWGSSGQFSTLLRLHLSVHFLHVVRYKYQPTYEDQHRGVPACRYVSTGNAVVVVHTMANMGGELGAQLPATKAASAMHGMHMAMAPDAMHGMHMGAPVAPAPAMAGGDSMAGMDMHMHGDAAPSASMAAPAPSTVKAASVG